MNTKNIVIAALAVIVVIGVVMIIRPSPQVTVDENAIANRVYQALKSTLGSATNYDQVGMGRLTYGTQVLEISSGTATAAWLNTSSKTQFVTSKVITDGVASSTFSLYVGTSTMSSLSAGGYTLPSSASLYSINQFIVATGTVATTTSSYDARGGVSSSKIIPVKSGEYLVAQMFNASGAGYLASTTCGLDYGNTMTGCDAATSTSRGLNPTVIVEMVATNTAPNARIE